MSRIHFDWADPFMLDGQLTEILQEEAAGYFAGSMTAEQAARNIQSRASLYLQEHRRA